MKVFLAASAMLVVAVATAADFDVSGVRLTFGGKKVLYVGDPVGFAAQGVVTNRVVYRPKGKRASGLPEVSAVFVCESDRLSACFRLGSASADLAFNPDNALLMRSLEAGTVLSTNAVKTSFWQRDDNGGIPYEVASGFVVNGSLRDGTPVRVVYDGPRKRRPRPNWSGEDHEHLRFFEDGKGGFTAHFDVFKGKVWTDDLASACREGRPAALTLSTERTYNWFSDAARPLSFSITSANATRVPVRWKLSWTIRDFDGKIVCRDRRNIQLASRAVEVKTCSFRSVVPRGIFFVEASLADERGSEIAFSRTNLVLLPPYEFKSPAESSVFGIANYWPIPDEDAVQTLMDRMGVVWQRRGRTHPRHPRRIANGHDSGGKVRTMPPEKRAEWMRNALDVCVANGNRMYEFGNEWNMSTAGIAMEGHGIGKALLGDTYAACVREMCALRDSDPKYADIRLISLGMAGCDGAFLKSIYRNGIWDKLDGICFHPGRGNFTPDYPYYAPETGLAETVDILSSREQMRHSNFWNFLGSVRKAKQIVSRYGEKPIWLTEVYACTFPNSDWEDTPRDAVDNVILTYALTQAEGIKCAMYHQLFDSRWTDRLGADPLDREYHFGLVNRDLSFKPVLMGYCTIAEALDGAKFKGWMKPFNKTTHALLFDTPRGGMAIIWDRTDGYVLTERVKGQRYKTPEPWLNRWKSHVDVSFPAARDAYAIDPIGRKSPLKVKNGKTTLHLTGSPLIVYGLDMTGRGN